MTWIEEIVNREKGQLVVHCKGGGVVIKIRLYVMHIRKYKMLRIDMYFTWELIVGKLKFS